MLATAVELNHSTGGKEYLVTVPFKALNVGNVKSQK